MGMEGKYKKSGYQSNVWKIYKPLEALKVGFLILLVLPSIVQDDILQR